MLLCQLAFQAQTGPAFADNLHLITKKANDSTKCTGSRPDNMRQDTYTPAYRQSPGQHETGYIYTRGTALLTKIGLIGNVTISPTEILHPVVSTITEFILI